MGQRQVRAAHRGFCLRDGRGAPTNRFLREPQTVANSLMREHNHRPALDSAIALSCNVGSHFRGAREPGR